MYSPSLARGATSTSGSFPTVAEYRTFGALSVRLSHGQVCAAYGWASENPTPLSFGDKSEKNGQSPEDHGPSPLVYEAFLLTRRGSQDLGSN